MNQIGHGALFAGNTEWMDRQHWDAKREDRGRTLRAAVEKIDRVLCLRAKQVELLRELRRRLRDEEDKLR